jgi:hypothetical protein
VQTFPDYALWDVASAFLFSKLLCMPQERTDLHYLDVIGAYFDDKPHFESIRCAVILVSRCTCQTQTRSFCMQGTMV